MIQLEHLHVEEFRGIRAIDLHLGSKPFVVHGPNGSGKSGIVDAIDFGLTGDISRLSGTGTGQLTLAKHGPHVHQRNNPKAAIVALTIRDVASGQTAVLTRAINSPQTFKLQPDTPEMREAIAEAQAHPELTLSRREIIKYVVSKPTERAQGVQALLKLNRLDEFRRLLKGSLGKTTTSLAGAKTELDTAERSFTEHLDITSLLSSEIARVINEKRKTLGLDALGEVTIETNFLDGITPASVTRNFNLASAQKEVNNLKDALQAFDQIDNKREALIVLLDESLANPGLLDALKHRALVEQGLRSLESEVCPLCDTEWDDIDLLRKHIEEKLERTNDADDLQKRINTAGDEYKAAVRTLREQIDRTVPIAEARTDTELPQLLKQWSGNLLVHVQPLISVDALIAARSELSVRAYDPPETVPAKITNLETSLLAEPDQTATDAARSFLEIAADRWTRVRLARASKAKVTAVRDAAQKIYDVYCQIADESLGKLYESVEADFSRYYQKINADDEGNFKAALEPSAGSLDLSVDFYGLGMFPPNAYHSEGHQDGMGVCLYLALVKQILGDDFRYAILDDVVMSVDVNHRRQFCLLLKEEFPDVQFIITTHDEVWARQMRSAGLITSKMQARFYGWTVDDGPLNDQGDIWQMIDEDLAKGDVPGAAHKLRRRLEADAADIAESIGGQVAYRGDANYKLGELLDSVKSRHGSLLKSAAVAADSWNDDAARQLVEAKKQNRSDVISVHSDENWIINLLVHNNDWAQASPNDFKPVLQTTKDFLNLFLCDNPGCGGWIHTTGFPPESLKCACGRYTLNLKKKP